MNIEHWTLNNRKNRPSITCSWTNGKSQYDDYDADNDDDELADLSSPQQLENEMASVLYIAVM